MEAKEILALDVGGKQTGIARASNVARLAEPLMSVPTQKAVATLKKYLTEHETEAIVVGLPRNLSGDDTEQTKWVRTWVDKAKPKISVPFYWQDEALTSLKARIKNYELGSKADEHALAAAVILQDFLDSAETDRIAA